MKQEFEGRDGSGFFIFVVSIPYSKEKQQSFYNQWNKKKLIKEISQIRSNPARASKKGRVRGKRRKNNDKRNKI